MATITSTSVRLTPPKSWLLVFLCALCLSRIHGAASSEGEEGESEKAVQRPSDLAVIEFRSTNLYPEGFAWDAEHNRFLVGSMGHGHGKLVAVTLDGSVSDFATFDEEGAHPDAVTLGMTIDAARNRVLAAVHGLKDAAFNALVAFDLDSKKRTLFVNLDPADSAREHFGDGGRAHRQDLANDVTVDSDGNAYVTNSGGNYVWKVAMGGSTAVVAAVVPQLPLLAEFQLARESGTNGVVYTDGYLLISQSNSGRLFRVRVGEEVQHEEKVLAVRVKDEKTMVGADGVTLRPDGSLVVVSVDAAWLVTSKDSWRTATVVDEVALNSGEFTTSVAAVGERVFTSQLHYFDMVKGVEREEFTIREVAFPYDVDNNPLWLLVILAAFVVLIVAWKMQVREFNKAYTKKRV